MSRLVLKSVRFRNFGTIEEAQVDFPEKGFILINGKNLTGTGLFESVGSGKTLLGEGISRVLFNVPGRFQRFKSYSRNGDGNTYVVVEAQLDGKKLVVEQGYECPELSKTGEGLRFSIDDQVIQRNTVQATREELTKAVAMDPQVAGWTVYLDGSKLDFSSLSENKAVGVLMGALNQPPWTEYHDRARQVLATFQSDLDSARNLHQDAKEELAESEDKIAAEMEKLSGVESEIAWLKASLAARQEERKKSIIELNSGVEEAKETIKDISKQIREAEQQEAELYASTELELKRAESRASVLFSGLKKAQLEESSKDSEIQKISSRLQAAKSDFEVERIRRLGEAEAARNNRVSKARELADSLLAKKHVAELAITNLKADRQKAVAEMERAEQHRYTREKELWDLELRNAENKVQELEKRKMTLSLSLEKARLELSKLEQPPVCPLAGCGKVWPKNNSDQIELAARLLETCKSNLDLAETDLEAGIKTLGEVKLRPKPVKGAMAAQVSAIGAELNQEILTLESSLAELEAASETALEAVKSADYLETPPNPSSEPEMLLEKELEYATEAKRLLTESRISAENCYNDANGQIQPIRDRLDSLRKASQVLELSRSVEEWQKYLHSCQSSISSILLDDERDVVDTSNLDRLRILFEEATKNVVKLKAKVEETAANLMETEESVKVARYWVEAYSPVGIPNMIIEESIAPLNDISRRVCASLTGGLINIRYATSRELVSGSRKSELLVTQSNKFGAREIGGNSKGEAGITDLIVAETLAEVGNVSGRVGFRFYDECARSQDPVVRQSIFKYMKELCTRTNLLIFVVDHSPEVANFSDRVLVAEKTAENGTRYVWQN